MINGNNSTTNLQQPQQQQPQQQPINDNCATSTTTTTTTTNANGVIFIHLQLGPTIINQPCWGLTNTPNPQPPGLNETKRHTLLRVYLSGLVWSSSSSSSSVSVGTVPSFFFFFFANANANAAAAADTDYAGPYRAHDRPPLRTTKTATLFTNPATSWQIDIKYWPP